MNLPIQINDPTPATAITVGQYIRPFKQPYMVWENNSNIGLKPKRKTTYGK